MKYKTGSILLPYLHVLNNLNPQIMQKDNRKPLKTTENWSAVSALTQIKPQNIMVRVSRVN